MYKNISVKPSIKSGSLFFQIVLHEILLFLARLLGGCMRLQCWGSVPVASRKASREPNLPKDTTRLAMVAHVAKLTVWLLRESVQCVRKCNREGP